VTSPNRAPRKTTDHITLDMSVREGAWVATLLDEAAERWQTQAENEHRSRLDKGMIGMLQAMAQDIRDQLPENGAGQ
jgi:hypothetical protein